MNNRELYLETLLFGKPDRIPFMPGGPRESTLKRWYSEGLDPSANYMDVLCDMLGIPEAKRCASFHDLGVSFNMIPEFEEKILERREGSLICQDWKGNVVEISDQFDPSYLRYGKDFVTRRWLKLPVEDRADWEEMKTRYNAKDPRRYPSDLDARCQVLRNRDEVLRVIINGPFWQIREWVGAEQICMLFLTDPEFIRDMVEFWSNFLSDVLAEILKRTSIDVLYFCEDMAFKEHSFISPDMTREFLVPTYRRWIEQARAGGCVLFDMDSDGYVGDLIPAWMEAGMNCCNPCEIAAGSDPVLFRKRYGRSIAMWGGVDKRVMARGGEEIRHELERILPFMFKDGGYIPTCDHGVPSDVSWPNFVHYSRLLAQMTGWI